MTCSKSLAQIQTIKKNNPSPFDGKIMPESSYRELLKQALQTQISKTHLDICLSDKQVVETKSVLPWVGGGFMLGILGALALSHTK